MSIKQIAKDIIKEYGCTCDRLFLSDLEEILTTKNITGGASMFNIDLLCDEINSQLSSKY